MRPRDLTLITIFGQISQLSIPANDTQHCPCGSTLPNTGSVIKMIQIFATKRSPITETFLLGFTQLVVRVQQTSHLALS